MRDEFKRLVCRLTAESFQQALELKESKAPGSLFKFFRPSDHAFLNLEEGTVYLSRPTEFNDPFDSGLVLSMTPMLEHVFDTSDDIEAFNKLEKEGVPRSEIRAFLTKGEMGDSFRALLGTRSPHIPPEDLTKLQGIFQTLLQRQGGNAGVFFERDLKESVTVTCFTERVESLLMWAHYADNHKGFCVQYEYAGIPEESRGLLLPVLYGSERFDLGPAVAQASAGCPEAMDMACITAALCKSTDWSYENEWRMFKTGKPPGPHALPKPKVVYAGMRMNPKDRNWLDAICARKGIPVITPTLSSTRYEMVIPKHG